MEVGKVCSPQAFSSFSLFLSSLIGHTGACQRDVEAYLDGTRVKLSLARMGGATLAALRGVLVCGSSVGQGLCEGKRGKEVDSWSWTRFVERRMLCPLPLIHGMPSRCLAIKDQHKVLRL